MPKRRMISSDIWSNPKFAQLKYRQQLLVIGLITNADDQGRLRGDPTLIRSLVFPYSNTSVRTIEADLAAIEGNGTILLYTREGAPYIQVVNWWRYQKSNWASPSDYPAPDNWQDMINCREGKDVLTYNWPGKVDTCTKEGIVFFNTTLNATLNNPFNNELNSYREDKVSKDKVSRGKVRAKEQVVATNSSPLHDLKEEYEEQPLIARLWEQLTGTMVSSLLWQSLRDYEDTEPELLEYAFREAADKDIKNWKYVKAIIDRRLGRVSKAKDSHSSPRNLEAERELATECLQKRGGECTVKLTDKYPHRYCEMCPKWEKLGV